MLDTENETAFAAVVDRYAPLVRARCERELGRGDADDAVQAVFVLLWKRWRDALTPGPALSSWLYRTTGHVVSRVRRDRARRWRHEARLPKAQTPIEKPTALECAEARAMLDSALAELPKAEREAVMLSQLAGHTYADVSAHQCCSKATVSGRVQSGMASMRRHFERRGFALSVAAFAALLSDEANASVPPSLCDRLHRLPAACKAGTAAAVLGANIIRWSRREIPVVKIVGSSAAALLCLAGLFGWNGRTSAHAADETTSVPDAQPAEMSLDDITEALRVDNALCVRWNQPAETWRRLRGTPLGAMIPLETAEDIAAQLTGIERIEAVCEIGDWFDPDPDSLAQKRDRQRDAYAIKYGADEAKKYYREHREELELSEEDVKATESAGGEIGNFPAVCGTIKITCSQRETSERWRTWLSESLGGYPQQANADGFAVQVTRAHLDIAVHDDGVALRMHRDHFDADLSWASDLRWPETSDLSCRAYTRPSDPAAYARVTRQSERAIIHEGGVDFWIEDGRLRLQFDALANSAMTRTAFSQAATLTGREWEWVPRTAVIAGAFAARKEDQFSSGVLESILPIALLPMMMDDQDGFDVFYEPTMVLSEAVDGSAIGYLDVAGPIPSATVALSVSLEACASLFDAIGKKIAPNADGAFLVPWTFGVIEIAHKDGRLIVTTDAGGIATFKQHGDEFIGEPDVAASLDQTGDGPAMSRLVLRTDKIIDMAVPMASLAGLDQEQIAALKDAASKVRDLHDGGWFVMKPNAEGLRAEAGGAAALIAALAAAMKAGMIPTGVN